MLAIIVSGGGGPTRRIVIEDGSRPIGIGRRKGRQHITLPGVGVNAEHARLTFERGRYFITDLSTGATRVNGTPIAAPTRLTEQDRIEIAGYTVELEYEHSTLPTFATLVGEMPWHSGDPEEAALVAAIARGDDASRVVYIDWLERAGDPVRAEFLRVQQQLAGTTSDDAWFAKRTKRLRYLGVEIDARWRELVARPRIERCDVVACPRDWSALAPTEAPNIRACGACGRTVRYCIRFDEARTRPGEPVVIDVANARHRDDLVRPLQIVR